MRVTACMELQPLKASDSISVSELRMVRVFKPLQSWKAPCGIVLTASGMLIELKELQA